MTEKKNAEAQIDSNMMEIITENADMLRGMATWINGCTDSVYSGDTKHLETCFQFAKEFNTQMKQITSKYGIEKESQVDIGSLLKKYNLY